MRIAVWLRTRDGLEVPYVAIADMNGELPYRILKRIDSKPGRSRYDMITRSYRLTTFEKDGRPVYEEQP